MQCGSEVWVRWPAADDGVAELEDNPNPLLTFAREAERLVTSAGSRNSMLKVFTNVKSGSIYDLHYLQLEEPVGDRLYESTANHHVRNVPSEWLPAFCFKQMFARRDIGFAQIRLEDLQ
jgi:hypothetical protein